MELLLAGGGGGVGAFLLLVFAIYCTCCRRKVRSPKDQDKANLVSVADVEAPRTPSPRTAAPPPVSTPACTQQQPVPTSAAPDISKAFTAPVNPCAPSSTLSTGGGQPGRRRKQRHRPEAPNKSDDKHSEAEDRKFMERMELREAGAPRTASSEAAAINEKIRRKREAKESATAIHFAMNALQQLVDKRGAKVVFDSIDDNQSGRVSTDELASTFKSMNIDLSEADAETMILSINAKHGSRRKALTYDIFCVAFAKGSVHNADTKPLSAQSAPRPLTQSALEPSPVPLNSGIASRSPLKSAILPLAPPGHAQAIAALQRSVNRNGSKAAFDLIDDNQSGRVSADELASALRTMGINVSEKEAEAIILWVNAQHGSRRKALTYDVFCVAFKFSATSHSDQPTTPQKSSAETASSGGGSANKYLEYLRSCERQKRMPAKEVVEIMRSHSVDGSSPLSKQIRSLEGRLGITTSELQRPSPSNPERGGKDRTGGGTRHLDHHSAILLNAIQDQVNTRGARAVFDGIDENASGRISADELAGTLNALNIDVTEKQAEAVILLVNGQHGSRRKALTYDVFCVAFKQGTIHGGNDSPDASLIA